MKSKAGGGRLIKHCMGEGTIKGKILAIMLIALLMLNLNTSIAAASYVWTWGPTSIVSKIGVDMSTGYANWYLESNMGWGQKTYIIKFTENATGRTLRPDISGFSNYGNIGDHITTTPLSSGHHLVVSCYIDGTLSWTKQDGPNYISVPSQPNTPSGLSADNIIHTSFTLNWLKQSDALSYNVYLDGTLFGNINQPLLNNPSFDVSDLIDGSTHFMTITAVNQWGESTASQPLTVTLFPSAPTELQVSNISTDYLDLSWTTISGATSYVIFQNDTQIATTTGTTYQITKLNSSTAYIFQVASVNDAGQSPLSNSVNATTLGVRPINPTGLSAGNLTNTSFTLYWIKQSDADSYNIYMDGTIVGNVLQPLFYNPLFDISNLTEGSTHTITVTAVNQWGESTPSQPLIVNTTVTNPVLKGIVDNSNIKLTWTGLGNNFYILVNNQQIDEVTTSPYILIEKPSTYQIQIIQNYNGQQYRSNVVSVKVSALQNVGAVQMTGDLLSNTGVVIAPLGGLLALALALKGSPMFLAVAKAIFLKS